MFVTNCCAFALTETEPLFAHDLGPNALFQHVAGSDVLIVNFTFRAVPPGKFSQVGAYRHLPYSGLYLNCPDEEWYRCGVQPFGSTPEDAADAIKRFAAAHGFTKIITAGLSKGGYAAILYGLLLSADTILTFGPELVLNMPFGRSITSLGGQSPTPYDNLSQRIATANHPRLFAFAGTKDIADLLHGLLFQRLGGRTYFLPCDHSTIAFLQTQDALTDVFREAVEGNGEIASLTAWHQAFDGPEGYAFSGDAIPQSDQTIDMMLAVHDALPPDADRAYGLADILRKEQRDDDALTLFQQAYLHAPEDAAILYDLARHLHRMQRIDEALAMALILTGRADATGRHWALLATIYNGEQRDADALSAFGKALDLEAGSIDYHFHLARLHHRMDNSADAIPHIEACIAGRSRPADALLLAEAHKATGNVVAAIEWANKALTLENNFPAALRLLDQMQSA